MRLGIQAFIHSEEHAHTLSLNKVVMETYVENAKFESMP